MACNAMDRPIDRISLKGFKSIRELDRLPLGPVNVLIGANGCGKSNFVSFFTLLREIVEGRMEHAVNKGGGADAHLHLGPKVTNAIEARLSFSPNAYSFALEPTVDNRLIFRAEEIDYLPPLNSSHLPVSRPLGKGHAESKLRAHAQNGPNQAIAKHIYRSVASWTVYHFHDTSDTAGMRRNCLVRDNERLARDASNLAAFLFRLRDESPRNYALIIDTIQLVAPYFDEFKLNPKKRQADPQIQLEWSQKSSEYAFHPSQLSDGTLRFMALATALLQPDPPATILIDEPELGLHPYALDVLGNLILQVQERAQVIVSTQSALLLNCFDADQVIVVERKEGESVFRRLEDAELSNWLEDYTLGELWQKNVYGGSPVHE